MGLFDDIKAFDAFFDDKVQWTSKATGLKTLVDCCAFPIDDSELFTDIDSTTKTRAINILLCNFCKVVVPAVGDTVQDQNGIIYKVADVQLENTWTKVYAREVK